MLEKAAIFSETELAVLLFVDMGNYGRNPYPIRDVFLKLKKATQVVQFVAYYWRRSGNFLFVNAGENSLSEAQRVGARIIGLPCVVRRLVDLEQVEKAVPAKAKITPGGSFVLPTASGPRKLIYIALSDSVPIEHHMVGKVGIRGEILSWPSGRDVLSLYDRPSRGGDVGQVTNAVMTALHKRLGSDNLYATGRAIGVIRDLRSSKGLRYK